ncbi:MAG: rod shape-determining protein MreC [Rhodospirillales bacterium]|nr:rod shape-determining protein MreC [Rhodospirillales bacterium]MCW8862767.1 rod shape-determining protein MreC [Rhodospirillales bacterium]
MKQRQGPVPRVVAPVKSLVQRFAYVGLIMAAFGIMMLGKADTVLFETVRAHITDSVAPIMNVLSRPAATVSEIVAKGQEIIHLRAENARLREANSRLLQWETVARHLEHENESLRELSNIATDGVNRYVTVRVIGDSGGTFAHSLVLSAGQRQGVRKGQAVVAGEGLVGRVHGVGQLSSRALLITDLNSRIPVLVESTRLRGILAGDNSQRPKLIHLPPGGTVAPGDRLVTSGHGGAFPQGLPVGTVVSVSDEGIEIQPFVDRHRLEYVRTVDYGLTGILATSSGEEEAKAEEEPAVGTTAPVER